LKYTLLFAFPGALMHFQQSVISRKRIQDFLVLKEQNEESSRSEYRVANTDQRPYVQLDNVYAQWNVRHCRGSAFSYMTIKNVDAK
ncbi:unnamed protein product, partial [Didymodactylos carnosus]